MRAPRVNANIVGNAGEYYVMCQLLRRGWIAALAPTGVPNMDIIVTDEQSRRLCSISVKTRRDIGSDKGWFMNEKHEQIGAADLFYCFVDFGKRPADAAKCYVVPSSIVSDALIVSHRAWHNQIGRSGNRKDPKEPMRRLLPDYSRHLTTALRASAPAVYEELSQKFPKGWLNRYCEAWKELGLPELTIF